MPLLTLDYDLINLTDCEECKAEGAWVKVKSHLSRRDKNNIKGAMIEMRVDVDVEAGTVGLGENMGIDTARILNALDFTILEKAIVGWSYQDESGKDIPVTPENIERMHDADIDQLKNVLGDKYKGKDDETKN